MAIHTYANLAIDEATKLADLNGISYDLRRAREFADRLANELKSEKYDSDFVESLSISTVVMYSRPFLKGARHRLGETELTVLSEKQREAHNHLRAYRDKHVAHSVSALEQNVPRADYCEERVADEGITGISCEGFRVVGLSSADLDAIVELTTLLEKIVDDYVECEKETQLKVVRERPLEEILCGGRKAIVVDVPASVSSRRKQ